MKLTTSDDCEVYEYVKPHILYAFTSSILLHGVIFRRSAILALRYESDASIGMLIMNNESVRMWKDKIAVYFKMLLPSFVYYV